MRELSLFTGAGGGLLGSKLLGWETVGMVEVNEKCQKKLMQRQADGLLDKCPIFGDIRDFIKEGWAESYKGMVDVATGGFPCQDISIGANSAGGGVGISGERSGLWKEMAEVLRLVRPSYVLVENSPMLVSRGLGTVLRDLAALGFDAKWGVFGTAEHGYDHSRERIFIYAYADRNSHIRQRDSSYQNTQKRLHGKTSEEWESRRRELVAMDVCERVASYSEGRRILYGMADWMDRFKAIGNGQVPIVVKRAWEILANPRPSGG